MKRKNIYILLLLAAVLCTSCKVGKSYVRPEMALPDKLTEEQDSVSIADEQWQAVYTDHTLRNLIERALEYNKDMLIAAARVKEMAAQKRISVANLLPQLNGKVEAEHEVENYGGHSRNEIDTYEAKALLSWELDLWGNLRWKKVAAIADYLQSVEAQRALRMTIVAEVAQAYYELVALDTELEIVRQTQQAREEGVRLARLRFQGGLTSETSYQQAEVELARTATLVPDLERKISIKENDIAFLAGEFPTRIERSRFLQELDVPESLPVGLPSDLLERRPDIRAAEQQLRAEHARVKVAYTDMFPRLALTGEFGLESDVLSNFLQSPYTLLNGAVLSPLFNWGKNRAALKARKASFEAEVHRVKAANWSFTAPLTRPAPPARRQSRRRSPSIIAITSCTGKPSRRWRSSSGMSAFYMCWRLPSGRRIGTGGSLRTTSNGQRPFPSRRTLTHGGRIGTAIWR